MVEVVVEAVVIGVVIEEEVVAVVVAMVVMVVVEDFLVLQEWVLLQAKSYVLTRKNKVDVGKQIANSIIQKVHTIRNLCQVVVECLECMHHPWWEAQE